MPCDSFTVTCVYDRTMAEPLHLAAGFLALDEDGEVLLRGIVDEYAVELTASGPDGDHAAAGAMPPGCWTTSPGR